MKKKLLVVVLGLMALPLFGEVRRYYTPRTLGTRPLDYNTQVFFIVDTQAELPLQAVEGNLAYVRDTDAVFKFTNVAWVALGGAAGAPTTATYITQVADAGLSAEQAMGLLGSGLVLNTTTTGVQSIYAGVICGAGTKATAMSASGALTCSAVSLATDVSGDLPFANLAQIGTDRVLGRDAASIGDVEELTVGGGIAFTGAGGLSLSSIPDSAMATSYSGTGTCGANTWVSTLNDAAAPTCTQPAFSNVSGLVTLAQITDDGTASKCLLSGGAGGDPAWTACPGGGGSANVVSVDVDFGAAGKTDARAVVSGQAWVTASSVIVCAPTLFATTGRVDGTEDALIEGLRASVYARSAGVGFSVMAAVARGFGRGVYNLSCTGS